MEIRQCPDCQVGMERIKLLSRSDSEEHMLTYSPVDAKKSFWSGKYKGAGAVIGWMCPSCCLIRLYGSRPENKKPDELSGQLSLNDGDEN